ncbi:hypothetical protein LEP1GSC172_4253 [Leptospira noguchii]|uniref:Uncharacterized protein n=2 Tax=Leptospira noguchii TaxID=28182 RepID=T0GU47_9LEPT|nr:hypothetical protein LEP1GSC172_4253 [Leptospira noguchii]EQA70881.1 hypothetical protein LEP1GSC059_3597 [Leptospira noguchii serovar Panama str. CZ214]
MYSTMIEFGKINPYVELKKEPLTVSSNLRCQGSYIGSIFQAVESLCFSSKKINLFS